MSVAKSEMGEMGRMRVYSEVIDSQRLTVPEETDGVEEKADFVRVKDFSFSRVSFQSGGSVRFNEADEPDAILYDLGTMKAQVTRARIEVGFQQPPRKAIDFLLSSGKRVVHKELNTDTVVVIRDGSVIFVQPLSDNYNAIGTTGVKIERGNGIFFFENYCIDDEKDVQEAARLARAGKRAGGY